MDDIITDLVKASVERHAELCDCMLAHLLVETGFKAKDVRMIRQILPSSFGEIKESYIFAHKNTPLKYLNIKP